MWRFRHQNESKWNCCNAETMVRSWTCHRFFSMRDVKFSFRKKVHFSVKSKIFSWTRTGNKNSNQRRSVTTISRHVICQCGSVMLHRCQVHSLLTSLILTGLHGRSSQTVLYWVSTSDILLLVCSVRWRWFFKNKQSEHCCHFCL